MKITLWTVRVCRKCDKPIQECEDAHFKRYCKVSGDKKKEDAEIDDYMSHVNSWDFKAKAVEVKQ
jgi:hypothetical protein